MYRSFDKNCYEMLVAYGYRYILIGDQLKIGDEGADFEIIPVSDEVRAHSSIIFNIDSPEALALVNEKQPVGLFLDIKFVMAQAMAA